jgi:toxin ParE1/3/4
MSNVYKNPQVIRDLIHIASYLAEENMEVGEQFLIASEETLHSIYRILAIFSCGYSDNPYLISCTW